MIDIIIPCYNAHNTILNTLFSILYQENISNYNVILVDDCSDIDYTKEVNYFKNFFNIKQIRLDKNSGPGTARRVGLENSNSPYVTFIDSDDSFCSPIALFQLYDSMINNDCDIVIPNTYEETSNKVYEKHRNTVWVHGKLYKRKYLDDHHITFNDTRANEDNGFNQLLVLSGAKILDVDYYTYIWRFNKSSITRANDFDYAFRGLEGYAYNMLWAIENAAKGEHDKIKLNNFCFAVLIALYYYYVLYYEKEEVYKLLTYSRKLYKYFDFSILDENEKKSTIQSQFGSMFENDDNRMKLLDPCFTIHEYFNILEDKND